MFDMKEDIEVDPQVIAQLMEQLDVFISIKPKPKQPSKVGPESAPGEAPGIIASCNPLWLFTDMGLISDAYIWLSQLTSVTNSALCCLPPFPSYGFLIFVLVRFQ